MEGGRATALVVGGGDRTDHLLPDSSGTRLCSGGGDPGRRLRRLVDPRWLADLLQIPEGRASELRGALNPPLPGYAEGVHDGGGLPASSPTLTRAAALLTQTPQRIRDAMRARPELVGGSTDATDTDLMR